MIGRRTKIPLIPEDGEAFLKALVQRKKWLETARLVERVGAERRGLEARKKQSEEATRRAKDTLARTQYITDEYARKVMRKARGILATKYPWED